jgi:hypothetical protein
MSKIRPGLHPGLEFINIEPNEKQIIMEFAKVWFITFLRSARFKEGNFTYAFAKPTTALTERYHFEREILILFSAYKSFDTRALDFVDKTIFEFQNRLDKLLIILVSADETIEEKITNVVMQDQESRIFIPFHYGDFINNDVPKLMESKLQKFFFTRDLFSFNSPLRSENYFFGRSSVINHFYDKYRTGENSGLFGLRKIGKTSCLFAIRRLLDIREEPSIFIDCQDPAFHMRRWNEALEYIIRQGANTLHSKNLKNLEINHGYHEKNASIYFEKDLTTLFKEKSEKRILLVFDEIESITFDISSSDHWTQNNDFIYFWQAIRSTYQKNPDLFSFIITGVNPKCVETGQVNGYDNPIYKMIKPEYLKFFDVEQVREMVSSIGKYMGLTFEDEIYTYLVDDYGGHPFLIRDVCSFLSKLAPPQRPSIISKFMYAENKLSLDRRLYDYLKLILDVLKTWFPTEYELLTYLAAGDCDTFKEFALEWSESISHLVGYGIVVENNQDYYFRVKSIQDYLKKTVKLDAKIAQKKEEKWKVISEKRNKLEIKLRKIILMILIPRYGQDNAKERLLSVIGGKRSQDLASLTLSQIMDSPKSEIYLDDLRRIILKYWDYFEQLFNRDRETFDFYLKHINKFRVDAHAKQITDDEFNVSISAFQWFNDNLDKLTFI